MMIKRAFSLAFAWVVMTAALTLFGAEIEFAADAMSVADGASGTVEGKTLTVNLTQGDYQCGDHAGDGWYVGATIKWPQNSKGTYASIEANAKVVPSANSRGEISNETSDKGVYTYRSTTTWWELVTAEDLYAAHGEVIERTVTLSGSAPWLAGDMSVPATDFKISIPTAGLTELKDGKGVVRFPAVAVADDGAKVWGDIDRAFSEFVSGTLKLEADVTSSSNLTLLSTLDLNGKTLTVAGCEVVFKTASRVEAGNASQIATMADGMVSAEPGSTFTFEPNAAWLKSGLTTEENDGVWTVVYDHTCDWEMSVSGDTLTAVCKGSGTCKYGNKLSLVLSASGAVYNGTPKGATLNADAVKMFVAVTGAEIGAVNYEGFASSGTPYSDSEAPTNAGEYVAKVVVKDVKHGLSYTLVADYAIAKRPLTELEIDPVLFPYDGEAHAVEIVSVTADGMDAEYEEDEASVRSAVGSGAVDTFYAVIVNGTGNFSGSLTNAWMVLAPKGDPLAHGGGFVGAAEAGYDVTDGTNLTVTAETALEYDAETETGFATMTVRWPHEQIRKTALVEYVWGANCTQDGTARVRLGTNGVVGVWLDGTEVVGGAFADAGLTGADGKGTYLTAIATENEYAYFDTVTWRIPLPIAEIDAAKAEGKESFEFALALFSQPYGTVDDRIRNLTGVRETSFVMTVPFDDIRLYDKYGNLVYPRPEHVHEWTFAGDGTETITATCANGETPCPIPGAAIAVGLVAESRDYDGTTFAATVTNVAAFEAAICADLVGAVEYYDANGELLAAAPRLTGDYVAKFRVAPAEMTLEKAFSITKPSGGYTDGWELARQGVDESKWVRYDAFTNAAEVATDGDTIHYRGDEAINQKWYDFTSGADIIVDLHGQTLRHDADGDSGFANYGDGTVTIVNADLLQPKGTWGQNVDFVGAAGKTGAFILGKGVVFRNQATTEGRRMTLTVTDISLEIVGGKYEIKGFDLKSGTVVSVKGGLFWENFNPSEYVPYPYAVREISGDYKYEVYVRLQVTPGVPVAFDTAVEATNAMATAIVTPSAKVSEALGSDAARETYCGMFALDVVPVPDGQWTVAALILPEAWTNVVMSAQEATRQIPIADIAAWRTGDEPISVHLTNCVPGFYYSLYDGAAVTNLKADIRDANCNVLCGAETTVDLPEVTPPPICTTTGFFTIGVLEVPSVVPGETETSTNWSAIKRPEKGSKSDIL